MKKAIIIVAIVALLLSMTACNRGAQPTDLKNNPLADENFVKFNTKTVDGDEVTNDIFSKSNLTIVNMWATWCKPCVEEMPDFQKLYKEYKDKGLNVIGLIAEQSIDKNGLTEVKDIAKKTGVKYPLLIPNKELFDSIISKYDYVPVTLFVDKNGKILAQHIPGAADYETLKDMVKDYVKE